MAAYAALLSLNTTIHQIKHHPHPPFSLHHQQQLVLLHDFQSLCQHIHFFQDFLENRSFQNDGLELEGRIAKAAYTAEDNIETHVMVQTNNRGTSEDREKIAADFHGGLQKILEDMDSIKKDVLSMEPKQKNQSSTPPTRSASTPRKNDGATVGLDDVHIELMEKLVHGSSPRQVITVTGMGGIGKTTLARNIYRDKAVVEHFHFQAWVSISQEPDMMKILKNLHHDGDVDDAEKDDEISELGLKLHKKLFGRRYLIVVDDIWDIEVWDQLKKNLPPNENGSRVLVRVNGLGKHELFSSFRFSHDLKNLHTKARPLSDVQISQNFVLNFKVLQQQFAVDPTLLKWYQSSRFIGYL